MGSFHRYDLSAPGAFIVGPARMMWAGMTIAFPTDIGQVINMSTFDAMSGWNDLGATKGGVTVTINNTEDVYTIDQERAEVDSRPTSYESTVGTALSEMTPERLQFALDGGVLRTVATSYGGSEKQVGYGAALSYTKRRLALAHLRDDGKIRLVLVRKAQPTTQEKSFAFNQAGDQQTLGIRFRALADSSIADPKERFGTIYDQQ